MRHGKYKNVDEYIALFPPEVRSQLEKVRQTIRKAAPKAEEGISYGIPAYKWHGNLVYFGGFRNHIGFYPTSSGIRVFAKQLKPFTHAKGSVQFPLKKPIPFEIIEAIVKFRMKENASKQK